MDEELSNIPKIMRIRGSRTRTDNNYALHEPRIFVNIDISHFPFLYRGVPDGNSRKSKLPPTGELIKKYNGQGYVSAALSDSRNVYLTKNPLVAFSADKVGSFSTEKGMILVVDPSGLKAEETELSYSINEVVSQVPVENIRMIYLNEEDAARVPKDCMLKRKIKTHNFSNIGQFRKEGALEIITKTAKNPEILFEKRYASKEEEITPFEGIDLYRSWIADSAKLLKSGLTEIDYDADYLEKISGDWDAELVKPSESEGFWIEAEKYRHRQLSIKPNGSKSRSIEIFKEAYNKQSQNLERLMDNSSFASKKYDFIERFVDKINKEESESFEIGRGGRFVHSLHDAFAGNRESEIFNLTKLDADLSDYLFNQNHQFKAEFSGC